MKFDDEFWKSILIEVFAGVILVIVLKTVLKGPLKIK